jgi:hypothetical protein
MGYKRNFLLYHISTIPNCGQSPYLNLSKPLRNPWQERPCLGTALAYMSNLCVTTYPPPSLKYFPPSLPRCFFYNSPDPTHKGGGGSGIWLLELYKSTIFIQIFYNVIFQASKILKKNDLDWDEMG